MAGRQLGVLARLSLSGFLIGQQQTKMLNSVMAKIYLASSWRNTHYATVLVALERAGHEVYDFRSSGFEWPDYLWQQYTPQQFIERLDHPDCIEGHKIDHDAMEWADTFVLVQPSGNSSHLEIGWAAGRGKRTIILLDDTSEPELMYREIDHLVTSVDELLEVLHVA